MSFHTLKFVPLVNVQKFKDIVLLEEEITLKDLLLRAPALSKKPLPESLLNKPLKSFASILAVKAPSDTPLYKPPGLSVSAPTIAQPKKEHQDTETTEKSTPESHTQLMQDDSEIDPNELKYHNDYHKSISEKNAVRLACSREIEKAASYLRAGLSVLVLCDKIIVKHLWEKMAGKARLVPKELIVPVEQEDSFMPQGLKQRQLASLKELIKDLKEGDVLIIPHLDLLAGGSDSNISNESREIIELVYQESDRLVLAFADRSLDIPEVLAARFAVRLMISGVFSTVIYPDGEEVCLGNTLITKNEVSRFTNYEPDELYKNVAGMNPIQIRHAIQYAVNEYAGQDKVEVKQLYKSIREFKVQTSAKFEVPKVSFEDIGGYENVKTELIKALNLMTGAYQLPNEELRRELIPRGFIFHGPPGTGKTLFAKAIASMLKATIQVVSGPEVTDMYVGESERKVRELFAEARKNAPSVLVFDEFDSIATERSGREDGGTRAGNALVAQILTEMDGFRPEVPMLVIGTTNRLDMIDAAMLRPSRFKPVAIGLPDTLARREIARVHASHFNIDVSPEILEIIAKSSQGMNGDEIRSIFKDACVGLFCENPPIQPDAHRFGQLVGNLRKIAEQKSVSTSAYQQSTQSQNVGPTGPMITL
jgi:transitional endoplasmic reticulum ATPase